MLLPRHELGVRFEDLLDRGRASIVSQDPALQFDVIEAVSGVGGSRGLGLWPEAV